MFWIRWMMIAFWMHGAYATTLVCCVKTKSIKKEKQAIIEENHRTYCQRHHYQYVYIDSRAGLEDLTHYLDQYTQFYILDNRSLFGNFDVAIEEIYNSGDIVIPSRIIPRCVPCIFIRSPELFNEWISMLLCEMEGIIPSLKHTCVLFSQACKTMPLRDVWRQYSSWKVLKKGARSIYDSIVGRVSFQKRYTHTIDHVIALFRKKPSFLEVKAPRAVVSYKEIHESYSDFYLWDYKSGDFLCVIRPHDTLNTIRTIAQQATKYTKAECYFYKYLTQWSLIQISGGYRCGNLNGFSDRHWHEWNHELDCMYFIAVPVEKN